MEHSILREKFKQYLKIMYPQNEESSNASDLTMAFYPLGNDIGMSFNQIYENKESMRDARMAMQNTFTKREAAGEIKDAKQLTTIYYASMKKLFDCIQLLQKDPNELEEILLYLDENSGESYEKPSNFAEGTEMYTVMEQKKRLGQNTYQKFKALTDVLSKHLPTYSDKISRGWLDGSNTRVRNYMWMEYKLKGHEEDLRSLSFFAEKAPDGRTGYRVRIETRDADVKKSELRKFQEMIHWEYPVGTEFAVIDDGRDIDFQTQADIIAYVQEHPTARPKISLFIPMEKVKTIDGHTVLDAYEVLIMALQSMQPFYEKMMPELPKTAVKEISLQAIESTELQATPATLHPTIGLNTILYGPPGTGKTYETASYAVAIIEGKELSEIQAEPYDVINARYNQYFNAGRIAFTTFHQNFGYEEFIEGIRPTIDEATSLVTYEYKDGIFKDFCNDAAGSDSNFVFIIDEINRGNIAKIFGELITLLEPNKRGNNVEELAITLPYTQKQFTVPNNVYVLGTMNTADRSIALIDLALRRRFDFTELLPNPNLLSGVQVEGIEIDKLIQVINQRVEALISKDYTIGHAYFMELKQKPELTVLNNIFVKKIIPLLEEYFYEDLEKVQLVLAENNEQIPAQFRFIQKERKQQNRSIFYHGIDEQINEKYIINPAAGKHRESYMKMYDKGFANTLTTRSEDVDA